MPTQQQEFRPTVEEIGARMGARTLDVTTGKRIGNFTPSTRPTGEAVDELIEDAISSVTAAIGTDIDEEIWPMAKLACIYHTCMAIEAGYYPETTTQADSAFTSFKERFAQQIEYIGKALGQRRPNERRIVSLRQETIVGIRGGRLDPWANELFP